MDSQSWQAVGSVAGFIGMLLIFLVERGLNSRDKSHREGYQDGQLQTTVNALSTQVQSLETNTLTGLGDVVKKLEGLREKLSEDIGEVHRKFETCRREETAELRRVEERLNRHANGGHSKDHGMA